MRQGPGSQLLLLASFFSHQPDLNHNNRKVVQAVLDHGERLRPWARAWYERMSSALVEVYLVAAKGAAFLPTADIDFILEVFLLDKTFYELQYELNNRPDWVHILLAGIVDIIDISSGKRQ